MSAPHRDPDTEPAEDTTADRHLTLAPEPADTSVGSDAGGEREPSPALGARFDHAVDRVLGKLEWATPPDIVRQDRPGLAKLWRHARHGPYAAGNHATRVVGIAWSLLAMVYTAWIYMKAWTVERPSRAAVAVGVVAALAATPWGRSALTVPLWLPYHLITLLTTL